MELNMFKTNSSFFDMETIVTIKLYSEIFEDNEFKCDICSLINFDDDKIDPNQKMKWLSYVWKRIGETYKNIQFLHNPSSKDVLQGSLGNCYLLSVCAVIAEYPNRLEKLFLIKEINQAGIYGVQFYIDGVKKNIIIDDRIPFDCELNKPPFCKLSQTKNIWPIIVEKAWSKNLGNYQNTIQGQPYELFKILTGAPSYYISLKNCDKNSIWKKLSTNYLQNYYICAATFSEGELEDFNLIPKIKSLGLSLSHAYSCLFFFEWESNGKTYKLVKLRNPWGKLEDKNFQGEALKASYMDNQEISSNIGTTSEGVFVLTFEEFLTYFSSVYICKYHDNYNVISQKVYVNPNEKISHFQVYKVNLTGSKHTKSKIFFSVNKPTKFAFIRDYKRKIEDLNTLYYSIFVGRVKYINKLTNTYEIEYVSHREGYFTSNFVELDSYEKSEYFLFVHFDRHRGLLIESEYVGYVSIYTIEDSNPNYPILSLESDPKFNIDKAFQSLIYDYYKNFKSYFSENLRFYDDQSLISYNSFRFENSNYGFILFVNLKRDNEFLLKLCEIHCKNNMEVEGKGIINKNIKQTYEIILQENEYFILSYYASSIQYKYFQTIAPSKEFLKNQIKSNGKCHTYKRGNNAFFYYSLKSGNGMTFYFPNHTLNVLSVQFNVLRNENLVCLDFPGQDSIQYFILPNEDFYLFFQLMELSHSFSISYDVQIEALN